MTDKLYSEKEAAERMAVLTLQQVADRLLCSRRSVEREVAAGRLRKIKIGHLSRVTVKELEAYIAAQTRRAA